SSKQQEMFDIAYEAQKVALSVIKEGVRIGEVKTASDDVFRERGYIKQCPDDSCGHGVGLEIHEPPRITQDNKTLLKTGYVLAIEPLIYSTTSLSYIRDGIAKGEDTCDFFLEDNIAVTSSGFRNLTPMEHDLWIV
ncbi:MAG: M24 family metallopeptidase, partial [Promethearchaeota archaeon]